MNISNKIKALLQMKGKKNIELAKYLGFSTPQALGNKLNRGSFSAEDLIKIADFLDCELAFIISDSQKITLTIGDIRESTPTEELQMIPSENQLRRKAKKMGYVLKKSRAGYSGDNLGGYMIIDANNNSIVAGSRFDFTLDDVAGFLNEENA